MSNEGTVTTLEINVDLPLADAGPVSVSVPAAKSVFVELRYWWDAEDELRIHANNPHHVLAQVKSQMLARLGEVPCSDDAILDLVGMAVADSLAQKFILKQEVRP